MLGVLSSFQPPAEGVKRLQTGTEAVLSGQRLGTGTLYIAESRLSWLNGSGLGFSLEYPSISLHAISRDTAAYPEEHLYVMVNTKLADSDAKEAKMKDEGEDNGEEEDDDEDDDDDEEPITEIRFVPENKSDLGEMFSAMCDCQALHPDPEDEDSDDDFEGEEYDVEAHGLYPVPSPEQGHADIPSFYTYEEGLSHLTSEGQATLERLEDMLANSVASQHTMAGVRVEGSAADYEDGMEVEVAPAVAGQFEDADVDH
ncbi:LOW QUALITY PROTEIN: methylosome subunit pICln [Bufo gargarizans]|uniref:LOW QUALITY PROTEIN: methylosome subunit pICln n=1 Tax=Bufo gargarizans TaxID=30331 RepID=UPI001CF1BEF0|nr:LOW QUALITY PROTEIN: methylosome subunit pICln [Bufo gargarizans]